MKRIGLYTLLALIIWSIGSVADFPYVMWGTYTVRALLLIIYILCVIYFENIPVASRMLHKVLDKYHK